MVLRALTGSAFLLFGIDDPSTSGGVIFLAAAPSTRGLERERSAGPVGGDTAGLRGAVFAGRLAAAIGAEACFGIAR